MSLDREAQHVNAASVFPFSVGLSLFVCVHGATRTAAAPLISIRNGPALRWHVRASPAPGYDDSTTTVKANGDAEVLTRFPFYSHALEGRC